MVILDDHLLRDWLATSDAGLDASIGGESLATTNLWYARLCKSASTASGGALVGSWGTEQRQALMASLVALPEEFTIVPMHSLAWQMGYLRTEHRGLSTLGAEAVTAAQALDARLLVSARDDGPGIRACCVALGIGYEALAR